MPNSDISSSSSSDNLKVPSDFRSIKQALKKPFANLGQKSSQSSLENLSLPVAKSGWLSKQGGVVKSWNKRWFVLRGTVLLYYADADESKLFGTINLDGNRVECLDCLGPGKYPFQIAPGGSRSRMTFTHENYQLVASRKDERDAWVAAIQGAIEAGGSPALSHKEIETAPAVFGQELSEVMAYESMTSTRKVPQIIEQCVEYLLKHALETEGIFRLPGRTLIVKQLKEQFDSGEGPEFTMPDMDIHSVASLLKMFLRELPQPLVTPEFYDIILTLCTAGVQANPDAAIESLSSILMKLPRHNYNVLQYLCHFLDEVSKLASVNKMSAMNLATIFVGSIIRPNTNVPEELMATLGARTMVAYLFITKRREIFKMEYNNQGDLVQVDTLIDLGVGVQYKKFSARTSVHQQNLNRKTASTFFDTSVDIESDLMQPLMPTAGSIHPEAVVEEAEEDENIYDTPNPTANLLEEFDVNMNGKTKEDEEDDVIYDTPLPRPASKSISLPVSRKLSEVAPSNLEDSNKESSQSTNNIARNDTEVLSLNKKELPVVPPRPNKWRNIKQCETKSLPRPTLMTILSGDDEIPKGETVTLPSPNKLNSKNSSIADSVADSVADSGHHSSESDSLGDGAQSPKEKTLAHALCVDVLPLSSISTLGSSASSSHQSVTSDLQDVKLCEISSGEGSSFSLSDSCQDGLLLSTVEREHLPNNESLQMSLSCGSKAVARRSRSSLMGPATSPNAPDKPRLSSISTLSDSGGDSGPEKLEADDLLIQELTESDASSMTKEELLSHVSSLCTELKVQRKKTKTAMLKLNATKEKSTDKIQNLAKQLDNERTATANAVERIIKLQAQLQAYQLKFGELDESIYGNTLFYG